MTKGVFLCAFGDSCYGRAAFNLALSIKHFDSQMQICLLHDQSAFSKGQFDMSVFDMEIPLEEKDLSNPARIKTSVYEKLPFEYNLYLDVDAIALKSIEPLFERLISEDKPYRVYVYETYDETSPDDMPMMYWATRTEIWNHYGLNGHKLPATQSSIQFIKKCDESKKLFDQINENLENPIPLERLSHQWGGTQPDELYLNIALAQLGITPHIGNDAMFFANKYDKERSLTQIQSETYFLSIFGGKNFIRPTYKDWYDRLMIGYCFARGHNHIFKINYVLQNKHADRATGSSQRGKLKKSSNILNDEIKSAIIPISQTTEIDSSKLLQVYKSETGRQIKITNWLNCSVLEFNNKKYFAYRFESAPFCVRMKIGICLLDENYQPIQSTNVELDLHTDIKPYAKRFHAEDPRLFIFNNELYLSYTDGYQMAQAKIDPETLQATESFYIDKPDKKRTEKNWIFFEYEQKLYSIYEIGKQTIFEMNNEKWRQVYQTEFNHGWKYGELRGGSTPLKMSDGNYISFFHSSLPKKVRGSDGRQYYIGAYTFEGKPPFKPLMISKEPILAGELIEFNIPRFNNKIFVVFPGGAVRKENSYLVSFGFNDLRCRMVEVSDELLKENLCEIKYAEHLTEV